MTESNVEDSDFKMLFDLSPDMMCIAGTDGFLKRINASFGRTLGYSDEELLSKSVLDFVHPDDIGATKKRIEKLKTGLPTVSFENRYRHKNGDYLVISWSTYSTPDSGKLYSVGRNTTEERLAKNNLLQIQEVLDSETIVAITDKAGSITEVNDKFCEISGYSRAELIGQNHRMLNSGAHSKEFFHDMWKTISSGNAWSGMIENRKKSGQHYFVLSIVTPLFDIDGQISNYLAIRHDTTDYVRMEQKFVGTLGILNETSAIAKVGGWELDIATEELTWTDETFSIMEVEKKLDQRPVLPEGLDLFTAESKPIIENAVGRAIEFGEPYSLELEALTAKGNVLWIFTNGKPNYKDGKIVSLSGTIQDINSRKLAENKFELERKKAETELRESEVKHRSLFTSMTQGVVYQNPDGSISSANSAAEKILGLSLDQMQGKTSADPRWKAVRENGDAFDGDTHPAMLALKTGESHLGVLMGVFVPEENEYRWIMIDAVPQFRDGEDKPYQAFTTFTDITQQRNAERVLAQAKIDAEKANQAKSDFLSSMSHELRTPLNSVIGFGQVLDLDIDEPLTENQKDSVDQILKGGAHLLVLINDVLDLAKVESGRMELSIEEVNLSEVSDQTLDLVEGMAKRKNVTISMQDIKTTPILLMTDFTRIKQVLLNLISNAIKYNHEGGKVSISCAPSGPDMLRISVRDTGQGIAAERQAELFQPFNRLGAERSEIEGTGIGLVVCKSLVELMGGIIGFESEKDEGSTFWFEVPFASVASVSGDVSESGLANKSGKASARSPELQPETQSFVLYIEDNPSNLKLMEKIVSKIGGLSMVSAHTAELGIELALSVQPQLIIIDINLPGMSGIDAIAEIKSRDTIKNTPVIALSAAATKSDIDKGLAAGFHKYLTKPIQVLEVTNTIKGYVN